MPLQLSVTVRNAELDAIESTIGTTPILRIYTGSAPSDCATAATGTVLAQMSLPSDWLAAASSGSKALAGTWQDASANASGTAGYFRIYNSGDTTCHVQGTVTATGGGGDLTLTDADIVSTEPVSITSFTLSAGNA
ncbi:MAG: hypothetical protein IPH07_24120 [Deltaproteobacteria bacterium]|nr:hypothetical protein [Deltaproteobacteria bacterium]MBK8720550.1 hypothetical protein [Deltaproteobacteria bacterium]